MLKQMTDQPGADEQTTALKRRIGSLRAGFETARTAAEDGTFRTHGVPYHAIAESAEALHAKLAESFPEAADLPKDSGALMAAIGISTREHAALRERYLTEQALRDADQILKMRAYQPEDFPHGRCPPPQPCAPDMAVMHLDLMAQRFEALGLASFEAGLEHIGVSAQDLYAAALDQMTEHPSQMDLFIQGLNERLGVSAGAAHAAAHSGRAHHPAYLAALEA